MAHLNLDVDTDQGVKVSINAGREALMYMLSAVFAEMMDDDELMDGVRATPHHSLRS